MSWTWSKIARLDVVEFTTELLKCGVVDRDVCKLCGDVASEGIAG